MDGGVSEWVSESPLWEIPLQWPRIISSSCCCHMGPSNPGCRSVIWGLDPMSSTFYHTSLTPTTQYCKRQNGGIRPSRSAQIVRSGSPIVRVCGVELLKWLLTWLPLLHVKFCLHSWALHGTTSKLPLMEAPSCELPILFIAFYKLPKPGPNSGSVTI